MIPFMTIVTIGWIVDGLWNHENYTQKRNKRRLFDKAKLNYTSGDNT